MHGCLLMAGDFEDGLKYMADKGSPAPTCVAPVKQEAEHMCALPHIGLLILGQGLHNGLGLISQKAHWAARAPSGEQ